MLGVTASPMRHHIKIMSLVSITSPKDAENSTGLGMCEHEGNAVCLFICLFSSSYFCLALFPALSFGAPGCLGKPLSSLGFDKFHLPLLCPSQRSCRNRKRSWVNRSSDITFSPRAGKGWREKTELANVSRSNIARRSAEQERG